jgi:S-adenosylmethionine-diacylglycerol 3-amino-3-carboxypropyl transferase
MSSDIKNRAKFDFVRYANVWEDADILCKALNIKEGNKILSISSAGDNCFAMLAQGASVVAVDLNPAQIACASLKIEAIKTLDHLTLLKFLGINSAIGEERLKIYDSMRPQLGETTASFWDSRRHILGTGFIHDGKFEKYFQTFRKYLIPLIHNRKILEELFQEKSNEARIDFYQNDWNNYRWKALFKVFFSRFILGKFGRDPEFFKYVEGTVSDRLIKRAEYAFTTLEPHTNPFLRYILQGNFIHKDISQADLDKNSESAQCLPTYLRPNILPKVKANLDRLSFHLGTIEEAANSHSHFNGYNLSDLFEYLSEKDTQNIYQILLDRGAPGARIVYWNMLVPRNCPPALKDRVTELTTLGDDLFKEDKAFFYSKFVIDEIK